MLGPFDRAFKDGFHEPCNYKCRNKRKHKSSYLTMKTALTQEQEVKQVQAQELKLLLFLGLALARENGT